MTTRPIILMLLLVSAISTQAQLRRCGWDFGDENPSSPFFQGNKKFEQAVVLPERLFNILLSDQANQEKFRQCRSRRNLPDLPREWFAATRVQAADSEPPAILVKGIHPCLSKEKIVPFWLFRETTTDYALMLSVETQGLELLQNNHNGYRNICTIQGDYGTFWETFYSYDGTQYVKLQTAVTTTD